jgi:hypothetical protein
MPFYLQLQLCYYKVDSLVHRQHVQLRVKLAKLSLCKLFYSICHIKRVYNDLLKHHANATLGDVMCDMEIGPTIIFGAVPFHRSAFSSKHLFIEMPFHRNAFSSKCLFIKTPFHQNDFSLNQHKVCPFTEWKPYSTIHWEGADSLNLHQVRPFTQSTVKCRPFQ